MLIALLPGDGIGPEVTAEAVRVLKAVCGNALDFAEVPVGGAAYKAAGHPLPSCFRNWPMLRRCGPKSPARSTW